MSISSEITRIQNAKASLKTSINAKTDAEHQIDDETLDEYSDFVDSITSGGGADLTEYYEMQPETIASSSNWVQNNFIKKFPNLIIPDTVTSLQYLFQNWKNNKIPTVYCNNNVTDISYMFYANGSPSAIPVTTMDLSHLNTTNVTTMESMFYYCNQLTNINLTGWNVEKLERTKQMFGYCTSLTSLDLSNLNATSLKNVASMFSYCTSLRFIDIRKFILHNITVSSYYSNMFGNTANNGVPNDCLIIVKDDTEKTWVTSKFSRLTNVKTVAEYEASLNS